MNLTNWIKGDLTSKTLIFLLLECLVLWKKAEITITQNILK